MGAVAEDEKIIDDYVAQKVKTLEEGNYAYVTGGYLQHNYNDRLIDSRCETIVRKLLALGYIHTTNHGFGCKDYKFYKES